MAPDDSNGVSFFRILALVLIGDPWRPGVGGAPERHHVWPCRPPRYITRHAESSCRLTPQHDELLMGSDGSWRSAAAIIRS